LHGFYYSFSEYDAVLISEPFLESGPFVMYLGDNLLAKGIVSLVEEFEATKPAAQILLTPVPNPEQLEQCTLRHQSVVPGT